jgi:hypothetical protein
MHGTIAVGDLCLCQGGGCVEAERPVIRFSDRGVGLRAVATIVPPPPLEAEGLEGGGLHGASRTTQLPPFLWPPIRPNYTLSALKCC